MKQRNVVNEIKKNQHLYFYIAIKKTYIYLFKYKKDYIWSSQNILHC